MPITQDRMEQLVKAGEDLLQALQTAERLVAEAKARLAGPSGTEPGDELHNLSLVLKVPLLLHNGVESLSLLRIERDWIRRTRRDNERKRQSRARIRAASSAPIEPEWNYEEEL